MYRMNSCWWIFSNKNYVWSKTLVFWLLKQMGSLKITSLTPNFGWKFSVLHEFHINFVPKRANKKWPQWPTYQSTCWWLCCLFCPQMFRWIIMFCSLFILVPGVVHGLSSCLHEKVKLMTFLRERYKPVQSEEKVLDSFVKSSDTCETCTKVAGTDRRRNLCL